MSFNINNVIRKNIKELSPYSSARSEFEGKADIWLDANENPFGRDGLNRYPDPLQKKVKSALGKIKGINPWNIFLGNGSDEAIDLLIRAFCEPNKEKILYCSPTYGMYKVSADINAVGIIDIPLQTDFSIDLKNVIDTANREPVKLIFICSPNNPTANAQPIEDIKKIAQNFNGIVIVDEAYIDFCPEKSAISLLKETPNLVVLQTLSKAWGLAGIRLGMAYASEKIIEVLNKIKPPYNINKLTQREALSRLQSNEAFNSIVAEIIWEKKKLREFLQTIPYVNKIYPSDANFLLVEFKDPRAVYRFLVRKGIVLRDRTSYVRNTLRITIGTPRENNRLRQLLSAWNPENLG